MYARTKNVLTGALMASFGAGWLAWAISTGPSAPLPITPQPAPTRTSVIHNVSRGDCDPYRCAPKVTCDTDFCYMDLPGGTEDLFYVDGPDKIGFSVQRVPIDVFPKDAS